MGQFSISDLSEEPQRPAVPYTKHSIATGLLHSGDLRSTSNLETALAEAAEEMQFDWPEVLPVERIKAGIMEIGLGLFLFAAVFAVCVFL